MAQPIRPVMLVILDGFGWREETADNAVRLARKPRPSPGCGRPARTPSCTPPAAMSACPTGQMGNSEVGHLNIGAGRVVHQELVRIGDAIADGSIAKRRAADRPDRQAAGSRTAPATCWA